MRTSILGAMGFVFAFAAYPASATVFLDATGPGSALTQVHNNGTQSGDNIVEGDTIPGPSVGDVLLFMGSGNLDANGNGYSQIDGNFTTLHISLQDPLLVFQVIKFDLNAQGINGSKGVPAYANITANGAGGPYTFSDLPLSQGLDTFYLYGDSNEVFTSFDLSFFSDTGGLNTRNIDDIRHIDVALTDAVVINPLGGVPEPSTWAMMLMGFGAVGFSMRRRKAHFQRLRIAHT